MAYSEQDILDVVTQCEDEQSEYRIMAQKWEDMWALQGVFKRSARQAIEQDGQEQVILPTPYNVVSLTTRLLSDFPKLSVPARGISEEENERSERVERWLTAAWQQIIRQQHTDVIANAKWQSATRGAHAFEVKWIDDALPQALKGKRFPIMVRNLDPLNVGVKQGPLWTDYAFHKYEDTVVNLRQRYPKLELGKSTVNPSVPRDKDEKLSVVDFWWMEKGNVWNSVLVEDKFAKKPKQTNYSFIPIVWGGGDTSFAKNLAYRNLSILHPIADLWPYMCRLASQMGTGLLWYFWPHVAVMNENGLALPSNLTVRPGVTQEYPWGTKIDLIQMQPNVPLAQTMQSQLEAAVQQATFPGVMYGQAPGEIQAGYGVSILANAAEGRIASMRRNLELSLEYVSGLMLQLVEEFAGADGVRAWGKDERTNGFFYETVKAEDIGGFYECNAAMKPAVPQNDTQQQTLALRWLEQGIVSREFYRNHMINQPIPPDEAERVRVEKAMETPEFGPKMALMALTKRYPETWPEIVKGTQAEGMAQEMGLLPKPPPPPQMGMPGMPPGMNPGMPPGGMPGGMQMPPGMPQGGPMPIQPPSMNMDAGTIPPQMGAQLSPEMMGLQGIDPIIFQQLMGRPMPPGEELNALGGV